MFRIQIDGRVRRGVSSFRRRMSSAPRSIRIVEVSPRDGLQNEQTLLGSGVKASLISKLARQNLRFIEAGSFVSPRLRQMANTKEVLQQPELHRLPRHASLSVLIPNPRGWAHLQAVGSQLSPNLKEVAVFVAASESFSKANLNMSISKSLEAAAEVVALASKAGMRVRGYISCIAGCPYEGNIAPGAVSQVVAELVAMGCYEVSLGDTIGIGTPATCEEVLNAVTKTVDVGQLAAHCHDTYGMAIANVLHLVSLGVRTVDSSIAGLGGCPYAPGASGNVSTEDVIYALEKEGYDTGSLGPAHLMEHENEHQRLLRRLKPLAEIGQWISLYLGRTTNSRVGKAVLVTQNEL